MVRPLSGQEESHPEAWPLQSVQVNKYWLSQCIYLTFRNDLDDLFESSIETESDVSNLINEGFAEYLPNLDSTSIHLNFSGKWKLIWKKSDYDMTYISKNIY